MTDPAASAGAAAPGWYPDASGTQRWWDGTAWTDHTAHAPAATQMQQRTPLPAGTQVDNVWVWVVALCFLLTCIPLFFFDLGGYMRAVTFAELSGDASGVTGAIMSYVGFFLLSWGLSLAAWGLSVFAAFRDAKHLERLGVVRPFHWAFAFIPYPIVYLIGRHVVLRKVVPTAGWPLWVHIGGNVVVVIASIIWSLVIVQAMMADMTRYLS